MSSKVLYTTDSNTHTGYREASHDEVLEAARRALSARMRKGTCLDPPKMTANFLITRFGKLEHELFTLNFLDNRHRMIACLDLFRGTIDGASVHPREVVKEALSLVDIRVLDHIVVAGGDSISFAERGLL